MKIFICFLVFLSANSFASALYSVSSDQALLKVGLTDGSHEFVIMEKGAAFSFFDRDQNDNPFGRYVSPITGKEFVGSTDFKYLSPLTVESHIIKNVQTCDFHEDQKIDICTRYSKLELKCYENSCDLDVGLEIKPFFDDSNQIVSFYMTCKADIHFYMDDGKDIEKSSAYVMSIKNKKQQLFKEQRVINIEKASDDFEINAFSCATSEINFTTKDSHPK